MIHKQLILAAIAWCLSLGQQSDAAEVQVSRSVHPVLIRNDHGPMVRVVIEAKDEKVRLKAIRFSLDDCDDVADLSELSLFSTGDKEAFSSAAQVGKSVASARMIAFEGDVALKRGKNVFWLSARVNPKADLSHRVAARCTAVETSAGKVEPANPAPVRQRIGIALRKHKDDGVHTYRIPALTATPKGTLLCVYDMRRRMGRDLQEDIDIGLSRSTDGGVTWEPVRVIMDMAEYGGKPEAENGCSDPGIIVDNKTGEIFVFAVWMHGKPGKHQWTGDGSEAGYEIGKAAQMLVVRSKDDGKTWSKPENLTRSLKKEAWVLFAPSPQSGINLADGTLLMPAQGRDEKGREFSTVMTSRDHGKTWAVGTPAYVGGSECQAVQLGDGSVMLNMRNEHDRFRAVFVTSDLGKTWKAHESNRKALIEPNCNGSLIRVDYAEGKVNKHVLLFANPRSQKARTHQTIQVSFDDGKTWPEKYRLLLDEGRGAGYPSLTRVDDRQVGIVYEGSQAHLVFEKVPLAELLDPAKQSSTEPVRFGEHLICGKYGYAYGIAAADLDGDGDLDLVSSDTTDDKTPKKDNGTLLWFENDGKGKFTEHVIAKNEDGWFERLAVGDIDGDGHPDVAVVLNRAGSVVWFQNPGKPAAQAWKRHAVVSGGLPGAYDVALGDFDGDGRLDVAASSWTRGNRFVWYRNPGKDGFARDWPAHVIEDKLSETRSIRVADFNGDGRADLLGTASAAPLVVWYENVGKRGEVPTWKKHVISTAAAPIHGQPADIDGDGDVDVVMAHGMRDGLAPREKHQVVWYENVGKPGKGTEWKQHVVGALPDAFEAVVGDLDGDGKLDIVGTAWGPAGRLVWFRNPGDLKKPWPMHGLKEKWPNANSVIVADLDGDRRADIAAAAERGSNEFRWWKNKGVR